jgi:hypothetical protein
VPALRWIPRGDLALSALHAPSYPQPVNVRDRCDVLKPARPIPHKRPAMGVSISASGSAQKCQLNAREGHECFPNDAGPFWECGGVYSCVVRSEIWAGWFGRALVARGDDDPRVLTCGSPVIRLITAEQSPRTVKSRVAGVECDDVIGRSEHGGRSWAKRRAGGPVRRCLPAVVSRPHGLDCTDKCPTPGRFSPWRCLQRQIRNFYVAAAPQRGATRPKE